MSRPDHGAGLEAYEDDAGDVPEDLCGLCQQAEAHEDVTVHMNSGPLVLSVCRVCGDRLEDAGRSGDAPQGGR